MYRAMALAISAALLVSGCGVSQDSQGETLSRRSTPELCAAHMSANGIDLLAVEAELGARGALQCATAYGSTSYVGAKTAATVGRALYARSEAVSPSASSPRDDKDCSDFATAGEAQRFFIANGGPHRDPHGLDGDGDGNACEWGKALQSSAQSTSPSPFSTQRPTARRLPVTLGRVAGDTTTVRAGTRFTGADRLSL